MIFYTAIDYQNGKVESLDINSKLLLDIKLSFEFFFLSAKENIEYVQMLSCQAHLGC